MEPIGKAFNPKAALERVASQASEMLSGVTLTNTTEIELHDMATRHVETRTPNKADANRPVLTPPSASAAEKIASGDKNMTLFALIMQLQEIFGNDALGDLKQRIDVFNALAKSRENISQALKDALDNLDKANKGLNDAKSGLDTAKGELDQATNNVASAQAALDAAKAILQKAQKAFDAAPNDPKAKEALDAAKQSCSNCQTSLTQMQTALATAKQAFDFSYTTALNAMDYMNAALAEVAKQIAAAPQDEILRVYDPLKAAKSAMQVLYECMLKLQEIADKDAEFSLERKMTLYKTNQEVLQKELEKKATEYIAQQEKMKFLGKIGSIFAKILGAILSITGVVLGAFTGGATFVVAVIGASLMATDLILDFCGKTTISEMTVGALMKNVIMPFVQVIANAIMKDMLARKICGPETAAIVGQVIAFLTVVALAVSSVAALVVGGGAAAATDAVKSLVAGLVGMAEKVAEKIPQLLKDGANAVLEFISNIFSTMAEGIVAGCTKLANCLGMTMVAEVVLSIGKAIEACLSALMAVVQGGLSSAASFENTKAAADLAKITEHRAALDNTKKQIKEIIQAYAIAMKIPNEFLEILAKTYESKVQTGIQIGQNMHSRV